jgi:hypothetical protein
MLVAITSDYGSDRFTSPDGGYTWTNRGAMPPADHIDLAAETCPLVSHRVNFPRTLVIHEPDDVLYRFTERKVERSTDRRQWIEEISVPEYTAQEVAYYRPVKDDSGYSYGPFDALYDEKSGNLLVAMGQSGLLLREPLGAWHEVSVGTYGPPNFADLDVVISVLWIELMLAIGMVAIIIAIPSLFADQSFPLSKLTVLLIVAALWAVMMVNRPYTFAAKGFIGCISVGICFWPALLARPFMSSRIVYYSRRLVVLIILTPLLILLPYVFWLQGMIPQYTTAMIIALLIAAACAVYCVYNGFKVREQKRTSQPVDDR